MASALLAEITDEKDLIRQVFTEYDAENIGLVQAADKIEALLKDKGLLSRMPICPRLVGVDIDNRGSEGVNAIEVGLLATDIASLGWSFDCTTHALAIEDGAWGHGDRGVEQDSGPGHGPRARGRGFDPIRVLELLSYQHGASGDRGVDAVGLPDLVPRGSVQLGEVGSEGRVVRPGRSQRVELESPQLESSGLVSSYPWFHLGC